MELFLEKTGLKKLVLNALEKLKLKKKTKTKKQLFHEIKVVHQSQTFRVNI